MSTVRLSFLYPYVFRAARLGNSAARQHGGQRAFSNSTRTKNAPFERHGTAVEPLPIPPDKPKLPEPDEAASGAPKRPRPAGQKKAAKENSPTAADPEEGAEKRAAADNKIKATSATPPGGAAGSVKEPGPGPTPTPTPQPVSTEARIQHSGPMDAVLHLPPPGEVSHPHISTPPYVHHFDSYTLVKQLTQGGHTREQAITCMKAVRALLAQNLDVAQEGLVSKSDVDNETYLFRAACSELSSEVKNNRKAADEHMRQQRTHLQHEVDILNQRMSQDIMTLKDDVKGMFDDRRMKVKEEQRNMESEITQIKLKIGVTLNSDMRSEIEGMRWVLARRAVLGIFFMAILTLGTLRYATYVEHKEQREADETARQAERAKLNGGREDHAPPVDAAEILAAN
ncbi:hypothetical protein GGR56DRAFT_626167 [Xylariaceae sp. FL0804]|nr:hypothetical protein GGR56DRAFT_626167 [Xylariaceae sp. FL0804]